MKLRSALLCLCMLALAAPAFAGQLYLNFNDCDAGSREASKVVNCANTSSLAIENVVASAAFDIEHSHPDPIDPLLRVGEVIADLGICDIVVGTDPLVMPEWWRFQTTGGCGPAGRLGFNLAFAGVCYDLWLTGGSPGTGGQYGGVGGPTPDGNRARIKWSTAGDVQAPAAVGPLDGESYLMKLQFKHTSTTTCPNCNAPACMIFNREQLSTLNLNDETLSTGLGNDDGRSYVAFNGDDRCPGATPVKNATWGKVKALYR